MIVIFIISLLFPSITQIKFRIGFHQLAPYTSQPTLNLSKSISLSKRKCLSNLHRIASSRLALIAFHKKRYDAAIRYLYEIHKDVGEEKYRAVQEFIWYIKWFRDWQKKS